MGSDLDRFIAACVERTVAAIWRRRAGMAELQEAHNGYVNCRVTVRDGHVEVCYVEISTTSRE